MTVTRLGASSPQIPQAVPDPVPTRGFSLLRKSLLFGTKKGSRLQPLPHAAHQAHLQRTSRSLIVQAGPGGYGNGAVEPLNVVFVSAEALQAEYLESCEKHLTNLQHVQVAPWSKTGGLGDVVGGLPIELARRGHRVMTIAPRYDQYSDLWDTSVTTHVDGEEVRFFHTIQSGVDRVFVDHPWFLAKVWGKTGGKLYGSKSGADYMDNQRRFLMFNKAALKCLELLPFGPGSSSIMVANDWHTAVLPVLIKEVYQKNGQYKDMKSALCIHNIAFQGRFWRDSWRELALPDRVKTYFEFEDGMPKVFVENESEDMIPAIAPGSTYQKLNWLRAGILTADKLLTVSPNYAKEVAEDDEKGVELSGPLRAAGGLEGIVNGIDVTEWSPFLDKYLDVKYDVNTMHEGKSVAKETLQAELGFEVNSSIPVFGFIGRLEEQKGVDILISSLPEVARGGRVQIVILGTGKKNFEREVLELDRKFPDSVKGVVKFDAPLAHLITAGADFMLVPSRFEPCGLIQLHAMNYGTVPVVASTGGLVDTVKEGVTGFHAGRFNPDRLDQKDASALAQTIRRAADVFPSPQFKTMRQRCIVQDLSWELPARKWESVLREMLRTPSHPAIQYYGTKGSSYPSPSPQRHVPGREERKATYPTPVQSVNTEGDGVGPNAVARKASNTQAVRDRARPTGPGGRSPGPRPAPRPGQGFSTGGSATPRGAPRPTGSKASTNAPKVGMNGNGGSQESEKEGAGSKGSRNFPRAP